MGFGRGHDTSGPVRETCTAGGTAGNDEIGGIGGIALLTDWNDGIIFEKKAPIFPKNVVGAAGATAVAAVAAAIVAPSGSPAILGAILSNTDGFNIPCELRFNVHEKIKKMIKISEYK